MISYRVKKALELEAKIKVQEDALMVSTGNEMYAHAYLLERLTDEWVELQKRLTERDLLEMAKFV